MSVFIFAEKHAESTYSLTYLSLKDTTFEFISKNIYEPDYILTGTYELGPLNDVRSILFKNGRAEKDGAIRVIHGIKYEKIGEPDWV